MDCPSPRRTERFLIAMLLAAAAAWLYWPTLSHSVVWDDYPYLVDSSRYWFATRIPELFFEPFGLSHAYYRPLALATFALYPVTADGGTTIHHAINMAIHAVNCGLLYWLLTSTAHDATGARGELISPRAIWPIIATLIFATHPVMIEGVAWLSGRFDLLMTLFLVAAMLADRLIRDDVARAVLVAGAAFFALLCKESVVGWIVALPLVHIAAGGLSSHGVLAAGRIVWRTNRLTYAAVAVALLVYLALRVHALGAVKPVTLGTWQGEPLDRLIVALITTAKYAAMTVFPWSYAGPLQPFDFTSVRSGAHLLMAALGAAVVVLCVAALTLPRAAYLLPLSVWLATLWPVLNIMSFPNGETIVADRYLMLPILLALYTLSLILRRRHEIKPVARHVRTAATLPAAAWLAASVAVVHVTVPLWRDNFAFWSFVLQRYPESATALGNLGREHLLRGDLRQAEIHLAKSFQALPNLANSANLAYVLALQGEVQNARQQIALIPEEIVKASTANERAMLENTFGWIEASDGNRAAARKHFEAAIVLDPTLWKARLNLAELLAKDGARDEAERLLALLPPTLTDEGQQRLVAVRHLLAPQKGTNPAAP